MTAALALAALLGLTLLIGQIGVAVAARHHAQSAADLAALAAAGGLERGTATGCAAAADIARRMGVRIGKCVVADWDVTVTIEFEIALGPIGDRVVRATARAGPMTDAE